MNIFHNKRLLFIGPLGFKFKKLNLNTIDYVIRTNNFFSIPEKHLKTTRCDILLVNGLYTKTNTNIIVANFHKLKYLMTTSYRAYKILSKVLTSKQMTKVHFISYHIKIAKYRVKGYPLILLFLLYFLHKNRPARFYVTGIDFYLSGKYGLPGYQIKQVTKRMKDRDKKKHDIESNIKVFKMFYQDFDWVRCDKKILYLLKFEQKINN